MLNCLKLFLATLILLPFFSFPSLINAQDDPVSDRLVVKFKSDIPDFKKEELLKDHNLKLAKKLAQVDAVVLSSSEKLEQIITKLKDSGVVEYIEPDYKAYAFDLPNDPLYSKQWALTKIQADKAWESLTGSPVKVAIVDTGINEANPDLSGKVVGRVNFSSDSDSDGNGHGTHVAGIVAASINNNQGVAGVSNSYLLSVKSLDNSGSGYYSDIANGVVWAADNGAKVINLSLGGSASARVLEDAINYAWNKGVVVVAAAGNSNSPAPTYPAYYQNVIAVGATDQNDKKASFSNYGSWVDIGAPGVSILSTYKLDYTNMSGTSMATPHVAGLAGAVFSKNPGFSNSQVRQKIEGSKDILSGVSFGRINACKVVDCPGVTPNPTPATLTVNPFNGEYFNNKLLTGSPILTRVDQLIDFNWGSDSPSPIIPKNYFSIRWATTLVSNQTSSYIFTTNSDDGVRVFLDSQLIIDNWKGSSGNKNSKAITLNANQTYNLKVEYFDNIGKALIKLSWKAL